MKFLIVLCIAFVACEMVLAAPATNEEHQAVESNVAAEEELIREKKSYGAAPSYGAPSYAAPAPSYGAPSYAPARLGPSKSYHYASPAPTIPCGQALVFSCAPSVANAPCQSYGGGYGGGYGGSSGY